jgi:hypothetical protein
MFKTREATTNGDARDGLQGLVQEDEEGVEASEVGRGGE